MYLHPKRDRPNRYVVVGRRVSNDLEFDVRELLEAIRWKDTVNTGSTVVVKPNMGNLTFVAGIVTHPHVVASLVSTIRDRASRVIVGESDGLRYDADVAFRMTGFKKAIESPGGEILNFSKDQLIQVKLDGLYLKHINMPRTLLEADCVVNVPVVKTHECTMITCAMKNMFGCIPDRKRILYHHHLNEVIVDINTLIKSDLVLTDGIVAMEGNGPTHGPTKDLMVMFASNNALANDMVISNMIFGISPNRVRHLALAIQMGLGPREMREILFKGNLGEIRTRLELPTLDMVAKAMLTTYKSRTITHMLYISPLFKFLNELAWAYRGIKGGKRRVFVYSGY